MSAAASGHVGVGAACDKALFNDLLDSVEVKLVSKVAAAVQGNIGVAVSAVSLSGTVSNTYMSTALPQVQGTPHQHQQPQYQNDVVE
jgi:hypothetical protein